MFVCVFFFSLFEDNRRNYITVCLLNFFDIFFILLMDITFLNITILPFS